jgi:hypothetical protein
MSTLIDVAISLCLVFLLFSMIVSGIFELYQLVLRKRASFLFDTLQSVFNDRLNKNYTQLLYNHPLINRLCEKTGKNPHYIPSQQFADALIDIIRSDVNKPEIVYNKDKKKFDVKQVKYAMLQNEKGDYIGVDVVKDFISSVENMEESDLKHLLRTFTFGVNDYDALKESIIIWFDDFMGSASTAYKRWSTKCLMGIGFLVALIFNVDAISLTRELYYDKTLREKVVAAAVKYADEVQTLRIDSIESVRNQEDSIRREKAKDSIDFLTTHLAEDTILPGDTVNADQLISLIKSKPPTTLRKTSVRVDHDSLLQTQWMQDVKRESNKIKKGYQEIEALELPIGWSYPDEWEEMSFWQKFWDFVLHKLPMSLLGFIVAGAAMSYGADNWFNLLVKLINVRTSIKPKEKSK